MQTKRVLICERTSCALLDGDFLSDNLHQYFPQNISHVGSQCSSRSCSHLPWVGLLVQCTAVSVSILLAVFIEGAGNVSVLLADTRHN
jgi:hypothetical protein